VTEVEKMKVSLGSCDVHLCPSQLLIHLRHMLPNVSIRDGDSAKALKEHAPVRVFGGCRIHDPEMQVEARGNLSAFFSSR
jgi:hypothetical protein